MRPRKMRVLGLILFIVATASAQEKLTNPVELTGTVKSETGAPLAGVEILTYAPYAGTINLGSMKLPASSKRYELKTDANGSFKIPSHGQVVYFYRADLRPVTKIVDLSVTKLDVTMEDGAKSLWQVPPCSASDKANRVGVGFMVQVPNDVLVKKDEDRFEEGGYLFGFRINDQIDMMINSWESTSLHPSEEQLLQLKDLTERRWASGDKWGLELRGTLPDGRLLRRISTRNGGITYQAKTKEAAKVFDGMIDSMCFDASAVKW